MANYPSPNQPTIFSDEPFYLRDLSLLAGLQALPRSVQRLEKGHKNDEVSRSNVDIQATRENQFQLEKTTAVPAHRKRGRKSMGTEERKAVAERMKTHWAKKRQQDNKEAQGALVTSPD